MRTLRLGALCALFVLLLNEPIISIVDRPVLLAGVPLLFVYVLIVWILAIGSSAWVLHRTQTGATDEAAPETPGEL